MKKMEFLNKLNRAQPALARTELIPILTHFWLTGERILAYNDQIAIGQPLETEFQGAIPGNRTIDLLAATAVTEIEFEEHNDNLIIKGGNGEIKLPVLPLDACLFEMPEPQKQQEYDCRPLIKAIEACLHSTSTDTTIPDTLGITLIPKGKHTLVFATNSNTFSHAKIALSTGLKNRVILSTLFCEQMVKLANEAESVVLEINDDYAIFYADDTDLFGKLIHTKRPLDYEEIIKAHLPDSLEKNLVSIPSEFSSIINRASIVANNKLNLSHTQITIKKGTITFESKSDGYAEALDSIKAEPHQKDVTIKLNPKLIKEGLSTNEYDQYMLTEKCAILAKGDLLFLVASLAR